MAIKCIIIDDEESARDILENLLLNFCEDIDILDKCSELQVGVEAIKKYQPNVVFLDIEMPNYAGYEIVDFFDEINFEIVFVTAYDKYALKAFEVSALDYLLKPIDIDRLEEAVDRLRTKLEVQSTIEQFKVLQDSIQTKKVSKIPVMKQGYRHFIETDQIVAFNAQEAYSKIYLINGETHLVSKKIKYYEELLEEEKNFFRTHKSWMINLDQMDSFSKSNQEIIMQSGLNVKLSRYRIAEFEKVFEAY